MQCWVVILVCVVLWSSVVFVADARDCFFGTTNECKFPCNCRNGADCDGPERGPDSGRCPTGQCGYAGSDTTFSYGRNGDLTCLYGNQAVGKNAWQSGTSEHTANRAADGTTLALLSDNSCSVAAYNDGQLHWYVDLGEDYVISRIRIFTEKNSRESIRGVHVHVTATEQNQPRSDNRCGMQSGIIDARVTIDCDIMVGRYVWIVHNMPTPDDNLVLCEVSVEGYLYHRCEMNNDEYFWYGPGCQYRCNCNVQCDRVNGRCSGECTAGWMQNSEGVCNEECDEGHWGTGCAKDCNCQGSCHHVNGTCDGSCEPGYEGHSCQDECAAGYWNQDCAEACNCESSCHHITGYCPNNKCSPGFYGSPCITACENHTWGPGDDYGCQRRCNCKVPCDKVTGECSSGCVAGYTERTCQEPCDEGNWGEDCVGVCHCSDEDEVCDKVSGDCNSGCARWYVGDGCSHQLPSLADTRIAFGQSHHQNITVLVIGVNETIFSLPANVTYREVGADEEWEYHQSFFHIHIDNNNQWSISFVLLPNKNYTVRVIPWDVEFSTEGEPSPVITVDTYCSDGFWGESCQHRCKCQDEYEVCNKVYGTCSQSGCADESVGIDCFPTIKHSIIHATEDERKIRLSVEQFNDSHVVHQYNVTYKPKHTTLLQWDTVIAEEVLMTRKRRAVDPEGEDDLVLSIPWENQYINTQYLFKVIPVYQTNTSELLVGEPSDEFEINVGCGPYRNAYDLYCQEWCVCSYDRGSLCLKTCDYCQSCTEEPKLPSKDDIEVEIQDIQETSMKVRVAKIRDSEISVSSYLVVCNSSLSDYRNQTIEGETGSTTLTNFEENTLYYVWIFPQVVWKSKTVSCLPITQTQTTAKADSTLMLIIIIIVVVAAVAVLLIILVVLLVIRHRRRGLPCVEKLTKGQSKKNNYYNSPSALIHTKKPPEQTQNDAEAADPSTATDYASRAGVYATPKRDRKILHMNPIPVSRIDEHIAHQSVNQGFIQEYGSIKNNDTATVTIATAAENLEKHRFKNILAYDHSRVELQQIGGDPYSTYMNASYIDGYMQEKAFIAAQGPKKNGIYDFWRMVWEQGVNIIVMVTKIKEGNKNKCTQYWPEGGNGKEKVMYREISIELLSESVFSFCIERHLNVCKDDNRRQVTQLQFTSWPDHGIPRASTELLEFHARIQAYEERRTGPLLVHCSAGVGRTGTLIAIDYLLKQAANENVIDVKACVTMLREDRMNMVQSHLQYEFIFKTLQEALDLQNAELHPPLSKYEADLMNLLACSKHHASALQKQFDKITELFPLQANLTETDSQIDRTQDISLLSSVDRNLYLYPHVGVDNTYINAVMADSYRHKDAYIMTQVPLAHTIVDFWRLVLEHGATGIVLLDDIDHTSTGECYWPAELGHPLDLGIVQVTLASEDEMSKKITIRDFSLEFADNTETIKIRQWHVQGCKDADSMLAVAEELIHVRHLMKGCYQKGPIVAQCHNGVDLCSMFVGFCNILEKMDSCQRIDVAFVTKQLRQTRTMAIRFVEQYVVLHKMVLAYLRDDQAVYYNRKDGSG